MRELGMSSEGSETSSELSAPTTRVSFVVSLLTFTTLILIFQFDVHQNFGAEMLMNVKLKNQNQSSKSQQTDYKTHASCRGTEL